MKPYPLYLAPLLFALCAAPSIAFAQGANANRAAARALAFEAQSALEKKDYSAAAERFTRADALVHAPTLKLGLARAHTGRGNLVAAAEVYTRIVREGAPPSASPAFKRAVEDAKRELAALKPRMPPGPIVKKGPALPPVESLVPEQAAPLALETQKPAPKAAKPPPTPPPPPAAPVFPIWKRIGVVTLGASGVALAAGAVTGILALMREGELKGACHATQCLPSERPVIDDYNTLRVVTGFTLVTGAALATTGALLLVTAPKPRPRESFIRPMIGPGYLGLEGAF